MLLISDFHDYYDTALVEGVDKRIVYNRKEQTIKCRSSDLGLSTDYLEYCLDTRIDSRLTGYHLEVKFILFCSKIYPIICCRLSDKENMSYYYSKDSFMQSVQYRTLSKVNMSGYLRWYKTIDSRLDTIYQPSTINSEYLINNKIVIALVKPDGWIRDAGYRKSHCKLDLICNMQLSHYEFYKAVDAFSALQEVMMWISGVLGSPAGEMIEIEDKYKVASKGFDTKYGFRTRPKK